MFEWIFKMVDLAGTHFSNFQLLRSIYSKILFIQKYAINLILTGTIFSVNGAIC